METEPPLLRLSRILRAVEEEENCGIHAIEIDERTEIMETAVGAIKAFFEYNQGDFYSLLKTDGVLVDIPEGLSLELAEEKSALLSLGPQDGKRRRLKYRTKDEKRESEGHNGVKMKTVVSLMETLSASGRLEDTRELKDLDQNTFAILAGLLAIPLISHEKKRRITGVLFEGSAIDVQNWRVIFDYLQDLSVKNGLALFLFILQGKVGRNPEIFSKSVNRIGIHTCRMFIPTNSYEKSLEIIRRMSDSLKTSVLNVPLVFFIGAGASVEAGFPPTEQLMLEAIRRLVGEEGLGKDREELIASFKKYITERHRFIPGENINNFQITFERVMTEELGFYQSISESPTLNLICARTKEIAPSAAHYNLSNLVRTRFKPIFLTTNYDDLIERSLAAYAPQIIYKDADFVSADVERIIREYIGGDGKKIPVMKFHGTIGDFGSIKASVDHTRSLENNKHSLLCSLLNGNLFKNIIPGFNNSVVRSIFVGYGFNDLDIGNALHSVLQNEHNVHAFVVNPNPTMNALIFLENAIRRSIGVEYMHNLISVPFSTFVNGLLRGLSIN